MVPHHNNKTLRLHAEWNIKHNGSKGKRLDIFWFIFFRRCDLPVGVDCGTEDNRVYAQRKEQSIFPSIQLNQLRSGSKRNKIAVFQFESGKRQHWR